MPRFEVYADATSYGVYEGKNPRAAIDACVDDAGYPTFADACKALGFHPYDVFRAYRVPSVSEAIAMLETNEADVNSIDEVVTSLREWAESEAEVDYQSREAMKAREWYQRAIDYRASLHG